MLKLEKLGKEFIINRHKNMQCDDPNVSTN